MFSFVLHIICPSIPFKGHLDLCHVKAKDLQINHSAKFLIDNTVPKYHHQRHTTHYNNSQSSIVLIALITAPVGYKLEINRTISVQAFPLLLTSVCFSYVHSSRLDWLNHFLLSRVYYWLAGSRKLFISDRSGTAYTANESRIQTCRAKC